MSCVCPLHSYQKQENSKNSLTLVYHTDFGNVENPPSIAVHSHSKSLCAHRACEGRTRHHHALLDPCPDQRSHGARAIEGGAGVHACSVEGYQEACVSKTGEACEARIGCLTMSHTFIYVGNVLYYCTFIQQNFVTYSYIARARRRIRHYTQHIDWNHTHASRYKQPNCKQKLRLHRPTCLLQMLLRSRSRDIWDTQVNAKRAQNTNDEYQAQQASSVNVE